MSKYAYIRLYSYPSPPRFLKAMSLGGVAIWTMHFVGMVVDILFLLFKKLLCSLRTKFTLNEGIYAPLR